MAQSSIPPPPLTNSQLVDRWLLLAWKNMNDAAQMLWSSIDFTGSNITDIATRVHADLTSLSADDHTQYVLATGTRAMDKLSVTKYILTTAPVTKTGDFTVADTENYLINNKAGSACTVTLPAAASYIGREITIKTIQAQPTISASSNVVPAAGGAAGTAILAATAGKWAKLVSDGTNWEIMAEN